MNVGDGHSLYVEECGASAGLPVLFLHGGPGEGCTPAQRQLFDPQRFRAILVDQRGAGRSLPHGDIQANTTADLLLDFEYIREALGIRSWILFGGAWGSLLALTYARLYPERVLGLVLHSIFLGTREEIDGHLLAPAEDARWLAEAAESNGAGPADVARIRQHYLNNEGFLAPDQLLTGIDRLRHLPAVIVQGMADTVCPPKNAEKLHRALPEATWMPLAGAGHGEMSPAMSKACIRALGWVADCVAG